MAERESSSTPWPRLTRRSLLARGAGALGGATLGGAALRVPAWARTVPDLSRPRASQAAALRALGRDQMRLPDSRPAPALAAGTDTLPGIDHIVVLMLENHSYDNILGMLGRGRRLIPRGDGFTLARDGRPTASNPYPDGRPLRAFRMPNTCQPHGRPSQEWEQSHIQWANGRNDGFVISDSGPVAMGYWTGQDLPFTYDLASRFPIGDRWFASVLAQTDPQRRFLIAATAGGMTDDIGTSIGNIVPNATLGAPANGTIFERLSSAGISWIDYTADFPAGTTMELYPSNDGIYSTTNVKPIAQFFTDAAAGTLPAFSLLDPNYGTQSQEDPQNMVVGEAFLAQAVNAVGASPNWLRTLFILTYDEHGGYFDHVPPPPALAPDNIPPTVQPGESTYDGYARYGFRVPSILVSPYAKRDYVSHVVHDHTSILALLERKWNLSAMTLRDANANDLTDFLDLDAMAAGRPTFPELPALAKPGESTATLACAKTGPGQIPPPPLPPRQLPKPRLELRELGVRRRRHGVLVELRTSHGTLTGVEIDLFHGHRRVARHRIHRISHAERRIVLREQGRVPPPGRYRIVVRHGGRVVLRRGLRIR